MIGFFSVSGVFLFLGFVWCLWVDGNIEERGYGRFGVSVRVSG